MATPPDRRITLREIAAAADVSVMTVSYALRDSLQVSAEERSRIQRIAEDLGYRPDPVLTQLMQHLRSRRKLKSAPSFAVLTTLQAPFVRRLLQGAFARAERLGYHIDEIPLDRYEGNGAGLTRVLLARGITGLLLAPAAVPTNCRHLVDWRPFSALAMTYSVVEPHLHRVVTHHYDNATRTFALLHERGFRRIGLAMTQDMEFRANHSYSGAYFRAAALGLTRSVPILFLDGPDDAAFRTWFSEHQPDAVVVANAGQVRDLLAPAVGDEVLSRTRFFCLDYEEDAGVPGIDQVFETIGANAIDNLIGQIHRNERGLPSHPTVTMVEGRWAEPVQTSSRGRSLLE